MNATNVLVVDDEADVRNMIAAGLRRAGFTVIEAADGSSAINKARTLSPDLVLMDVMLPGMSGFEICRALKSESGTARIPIIFVTAKTDEIDRIVGLELGAEDYIVKPFSPRELVLRVKAALRRGRAETDLAIGCGVISLNRARHRVELDGNPINLTTTEFRLLALLLEGRGSVRSRSKLLAEVWGEGAEVDVRTIDTHIRRLREKLGAAANHIETVRGFGYRITSESPARC